MTIAAVTVTCDGCGTVRNVTAPTTRAARTALRTRVDWEHKVENGRTVDRCPPCHQHHARELP